MTVRGIEAIKLYLPPTKSAIGENIRVETGLVTQELDESTETMTSVERYRLEWIQLLRTLETDPERIRYNAFNGDLKVSKFRSIYWALLLRVLNAEHDRWCIQRAQQRTRYEKFKVDFVRNPHEMDATDDDPLSQSTKSVWNQYFSDQELFGIIRQDVVRTFPGVDFFRKPLVQNTMANILFYYAREHPYMGYRQGMHEILAPIIFVVYGDHQSLLHYKEIAKTDINETLLDVLNPQYLEADAYSIFSRLMSSVESYYRVSNLLQTTSGYNSPQTDDPSKDVQTEVEVIGQLNIIRDKILAREDLHLHNCLQELDIPLHIFGIRWLRLLFGREFPLLDLLILWDAIFADSDRFDLPNYILVAMLVHIRDKLLMSDYTSCLTLLMRYPGNVDVSLVLRHALHMSNPKKFERPPNAFSFVSFGSTTSQFNSKTGNSTNARQNATSVANTVGTLPTALAKSSTPQRSSSMIALTNTDKQIQFMQTRNAADAAAMAKLKIAPQANPAAMDGYLENSPELMRLELKNAQTVIKIARSKLQTYLGTVRKHTSKQQTNEELEKTLDGIEELCSFLDVKFMFPLQTRSAPIDQAHEADEQQQRMEQEMTQSTKPTNLMAQLEDLQMSDDINETSRNISYEKPESALMYNQARMLGDKREIELIAIARDEKPWLATQNGLPAVDPQGYRETP